MNGTAEHGRFEELAVGHALSALEPEDEQRFLQHLAACAACERDVQEHLETVSLLALSADPVDPPPSVLEGIRVRTATGGVTASAPVPAGVRSLDEARARRTDRTARWTGLAAAAALVLSLGAWNVALRSDRDASEQYGDRLAAAVRDLARPGSTSVPLQSEGGDVLAVAVVRDDQVSLVLDGLQANGSATTYVLWAQEPSGEVRAVGAFDVEQEQVDVVADLPVAGGEPVTAYLLSEEPGDVAPVSPAGPLVASGEV